MGSVQSMEIPPIMVPTDEPTKENEGPVYRNIHCYVENGGTLISTFRSQPESRTAIDILKKSSIKYADCDCVGERDTIGEVAGNYQFIKYSDFFQRVIAFGKGLLEMGLKRGDKIGLYSCNSIFWQTAAFGAYSVGMVIVPVYDSLGPQAAEYIINHAEIKLLCASKEKANAAIELIPKSEFLKFIAIMSKEQPLLEGSIPVHSFEYIIESGVKSNHESDFATPDDTAIIMYTSGSTGVPKGCVLKQKNIVSGSAGLGCVNLSLMKGDTYLSFLPLAHIYALSVELIMFAQGVRIGYARGPVNFLLDDIKTLQPTILCVVPRILNRIVEAMRKKIDALSPILRTIIKATMKSKIENLRQNKPQSLLLDGVLFKEFRAALGGRARIIVSGGAPIMGDVFEFLAATITPNIVQGYGLTEVASCLSVQEVPAFNPATVGAVSITCEMKLRRVEGTDYDPHAVVPKGEILVRGPNVFAGYYKQPELTKEVLSEDGWFATGDVGMITPEKQLQIIDRAKQLVKLSQGEYLSLTALTEMYTMAENVQFMYIYADSLHDKPVAVVIPKPEKLKEWESKGLTNFNESPIAKKEIQEALEKVFINKKLRGFERISNFIIDIEEPTIANGLLTPKMAPQFQSLRRKYEKQLLSLYLNE